MGVFLRWVLDEGVATPDQETVNGFLKYLAQGGMTGRALAEVLYSSGMRIAELLGLDLGDVDFGSATAKVLGKGRKERLVPVGRTALQYTGRLHQGGAAFGSRGCATELLRGGANMYHVKELLGHDSLDTLKHYARLTILDLKKEHERCHPREKDHCISN